jgi:hypothetical protein
MHLLLLVHQTMDQKPIYKLNKDLYTHICEFTSCKNLLLTCKRIYEDTKHIKKIYLPWNESKKYMSSSCSKTKYDELVSYPHKQLFFIFPVTKNNGSELQIQISEWCEQINKTQIILQLDHIKSDAYMTSEIVRGLINNNVVNPKTQVRLVFQTCMNLYNTVHGEIFYEHCMLRFKENINTVALNHISTRTCNKYIGSIYETTFCPESKGNVPCCFLKNLDLLTHVRIVNIFNCCLITQFPLIPSMEELDIDSCDRLKNIQIGPRLKNIRVRECRKLVLPNSFVSLDRIELKYVSIECNEPVKSIMFDKIGVLDISVCGIEKITSITNTKTVSIEFCRELIEITDVFDVMNINIESCANFNKFVNMCANNISFKLCKQLIILKKIKYANSFSIELCPKLERVSGFEFVETVSIFSCQSLLSIRTLVNVGMMYLNKCYLFDTIHKLENVMNYETDSKRLRELFNARILT